MPQKITWFTQENLDSGLSLARESGLPVLVDFWSPGCKGCEAFDAVTYRDPAVISFVSTHFVPLKYNTHAVDSNFRVLSGQNAFLWTPTLAVLGAKGREVRRMVGYLTPADLLAELRLALGLVELHRSRPGLARGWFEEVLKEPVTHVAPESLYWLGVAAYYENGRSFDALSVHWKALGQRWPESTWWRRAHVLGPRAFPEVAEPAARDGGVALASMGNGVGAGC